MKDIFHPDRLDLMICQICGIKIIPDKKAVNDNTGKWDGHSYKFDCECNSKDLRLCYG